MHRRLSTCFSEPNSLIFSCFCFRDGGADGTVTGGGHGVGGGGVGIGGGGGGASDRRSCGGGRRAPSLRLANGRVAAAQSEEEIRSPPPYSHCRLAKDDSIKISIENTNTCTDSLVTALDDETLLIADYLSNDNMNYKGSSGKVRISTT